MVRCTDIYIHVKEVSFLRLITRKFYLSNTTKTLWLYSKDGLLTVLFQAFDKLAESAWKCYTLKVKSRDDL